MALRPLAEDDLDLILAWRNSPSVRRGMIHSHLITPTEHSEWFARVLTSPDCRWLMYSRDGLSAGVGYITDISPTLRTARWGFYKAPDSLPGTGLRLCTELLTYAFVDLPVDQITGVVLPDNAASIRIHTTLGFTLLGSADAAPIHSAERGILFFQITRRQWNDITKSHTLNGT